MHSSERAPDARLRVRERHEPCRTCHVCSRLGVGPGVGVHAGANSDSHQLVPGGVELDLVDALPEAVEGPERGRVLVGQAPELDRLASAEPAERGALVRAGCAALAQERLHERAGLREEVVALERRRLVGGAEVGGRGRAPSLRHSPATRKDES